MSPSSTVAIHAHVDTDVETHEAVYASIRECFEDHINPALEPIDATVDVVMGARMTFDPTRRSDNSNFDGWRVVNDHPEWGDRIDPETTHTFLVSNTLQSTIAEWLSSADITGYGYSHNEVLSTDESFSVTNIGALDWFNSAAGRDNLAIHEVLHTFSCSHRHGDVEVNEADGPPRLRITPMATAYVLRERVGWGPDIVRLESDLVFPGTGDRPDTFCSTANYRYPVSNVEHVPRPSSCTLDCIVSHVEDHS